MTLRPLPPSLLFIFMSTSRRRSSPASKAAQFWSTLASAHIGATKPSPANGPSSSIVPWRLPASLSQRGCPLPCSATARDALREIASGHRPPQLRHLLMMPLHRHRCRLFWRPDISRSHRAKCVPSTSTYLERIFDTPTQIPTSTRMLPMYKNLQRAMPSSPTMTKFSSLRELVWADTGALEQRLAKPPSCTALASGMAS